MKITCDNFVFTSDFDSGNLASVKRVVPTPSVDSETEESKELPNGTAQGHQEVPAYEFNIWTKPDCAGTEYENGNRTWFYFGLRGPPLTYVKLNIVNLNRQTKLFHNGMQPVFKVVPGKHHWERIKEKPTFLVNENSTTLSFTHRTQENARATVYFAFTFPYSYQELQFELFHLDEKFNPLSYSLDDSHKIYYHRECVCYSLQGRRVDLITISSRDGMSKDVQEPRLRGLFPDTDVPRAFLFPRKKAIFVSARVHPGETPSSFVMKGFMHFLLDEHDPRAITLRRMYVFKLVPMLNPDGVHNGQYRTDTLGVNLNRVYLSPSKELHPSIFAARSLMLYYHYREEVEVTFAASADEKSSNDMITTTANCMKIVTAPPPLPLQDEEEYLCFMCGQFYPISHTSSHQCGNGDSSGMESDANAAGTKSKVQTDLSSLEKPPERIKSSTLRKADANTNMSGLFLYVDLHGHASKRGIFMYGNHFNDLDTAVDCMLLPKLLSINSPNFDFTACNFSERNMYSKDKRDGMSKEGSGRVAMYKLTNLIRSYTLECNYNTGNVVNSISSASRDSGRASPPAGYHYPPKYTPQVYEEVGKSLAVSILDLTNSNPWSRLSTTEYRSLNQVKEWLRRHCTLQPQPSSRNASYNCSRSGLNKKSDNICTPTRTQYLFSDSSSSSVSTSSSITIVKTSSNKAGETESCKSSFSTIPSPKASPPSTRPKVRSDPLPPPILPFNMPKVTKPNTKSTTLAKQPQGMKADVSTSSTRRNPQQSQLSLVHMCATLGVGILQQHLTSPSSHPTSSSTPLLNSRGIVLPHGNPAKPSQPLLYSRSSLGINERLKKRLLQVTCGMNLTQLASKMEVASAVDAPSSSIITFTKVKKKSVQETDKQKKVLGSGQEDNKRSKGLGSTQEEDRRKKVLGSASGVGPARVPRVSKRLRPSSMWVPQEEAKVSAAEAEDESPEEAPAMTKRGMRSVPVAPLPSRQKPLEATSTTTLLARRKRKKIATATSLQSSSTRVAVGPAASSAGSSHGTRRMAVATAVAAAAVKLRRRKVGKKSGL